MIPTWLNETVQAFGRQMHLTRFALNERGVAGVRFENGLAFRLEYANESLLVSVAFAVLPEAPILQRVLMQAHPDAARGGSPVRAAYLSRTGEALLVLRLPERDVTVTVLEAAFRRLWTLGESVRRAVE